MHRETLASNAIDYLKRVALNNTNLNQISSVSISLSIAIRALLLIVMQNANRSNDARSQTPENWTVYALLRTSHAD